MRESFVKCFSDQFFSEEGRAEMQLILKDWHKRHRVTMYKMILTMLNDLNVQKLYQHRPQIAKTNFCEQCHVCKKLKTKFIAVFLGVWVKLVALKIGTYETEIGTLQWHPALPQSWPSPSSPHHSTLQWQWHPAMAPRSLPQSGPSPSSPHHSTQQWQWHPAMAPRPLLQSWSAHYNGTQKWHHVHCTLQWHPGATSNPPKWVVALPPIGSKNPYSYRYLGNDSYKNHIKITYSKASKALYFAWSEDVDVDGNGALDFLEFLVLMRRCDDIRDESVSWQPKKAATSPCTNTNPYKSNISQHW